MHMHASPTSLFILHSAIHIMILHCDIIFEQEGYCWPYVPF